MGDLTREQLGDLSRNDGDLTRERLGEELGDKDGDLPKEMR